jgi:hypothetical protein
VSKPAGNFLLVPCGRCNAKRQQPCKKVGPFHTEADAKVGMPIRDLHRQHYARKEAFFKAMKGSK